MSKKEVIYVDVEDDITTIIDKAASSKSDIVALVLPKRATVLQSIVNMKLLKKAADDASKKLVLITTENTLLPLAGSTGLHVAESLQSRPHVPEPIAAVDQEDTLIEDEPDIDPQESIGDLHEKSSAGAAAGAAGKVTEKARKTLGLKKGGSKLKIPNFSSFRNRLILGGVLLVLLITGWVFGFIILPKATVAIQAQTTPLPTEVRFRLDPDAESSDVDKKILAVRLEEIIKTVANEFEATGEKNVGEKAEGIIEVTNNCYNPGTLAAGTVFTSNQGLQFESTESVKVPTSTTFQGECEATTADVPVIALERGDQYNLAPTGYTVGDIDPQDVSGYGNQMSGGTTEIVSVVTQEDINKAKNGIQPADEEEMLAQLRQQFGDDVIMVPETFDAKKGEVSSSPDAGTEANQGRVTAQYTYTAFGVEKDVLKQLLESAQQEKIDTELQVVLDTGIENVTLSLVDTENDDTNLITVAAETEGYAGPDFDTQQIAEEVEGMRYSEVIETIKAKPGVSQVEVDFSPFWVFSAPKASRTTINIEVSEQTLQ